MKRSLSEIIELVLYAAWRRRYLICVPILLMIPLSIIGARFVPKAYEAKTILLLQETGKDNPFLKDYVVGLNVKERIAALQALLKSEHVLLNVLRDILPASDLEDPREVAVRMQRLSGQISVSLFGTDLLELKLKGTRPSGMGKTLAAIKDRFLERLLSPEQSTLSSTQEFLRRQLDHRKATLTEAQQKLTEFQAHNGGGSQALHGGNVVRLGSLRQQLQEKSMQLQAAAVALDDLKRQIVSANPVVGRIEEGIVQTTAELASLRAKYTSEHSEVQAAERRLARLKSERGSYLELQRSVDTLDLDRLWSLASATSAAADKTPTLLVSQLLRLQEANARRLSLKSDTDQISRAVAELERTVSSFAPMEQQLKQLEQDVTVARESYDAVLARYEKASTSRELGRFESSERVKVIDHPQDPTIPSTPPPIIFVLAGIFAGIGLGVGLAVVAELLDNKVRTATRFQELTGIPVLGRLSRFEPAGAV